MPNIDDSQSSLTPREREVLALAQQGRTNNEIATALGITRNAVRFHLKDIHSKLETGSRRSVLSRGWSRGLGILGFPIAKLGVPVTIAVFTGGIVLTGFAAYRVFPSDSGPAAPKRFEGVVLVDGRYENGCPTEYTAGTMTLSDFAHGETTLAEMHAANPGLPDGRLEPETIVSVPYDRTTACYELEPTPAGAPKAFGTPPRR